MTNLFDYIGGLAAICTTVAFIPQVIQTIKTKNTKSISLGMYIIFIIGLISWLIYGIHLNEAPLIYANAVTLCLAGIILAYKLKYK
jgi:MtN3 and saliva related transmembrane protein